MTDPVSPHTMLPAKEAGHLVGYTADYVSKLAREGKIVGKKIGKMWFVDEASLRKFSRGIASVEKQRLEALRKSRVTEYKNGHERRLPEQKHFHPRAGTTPIVCAFLRQFAGASVAALVFAISFFAGYSYVRIAPLQKAAALFASVEHGGQKARARPVPVFEATDTFARFAARQGERAVDTTVSALQDSFHVPYAESPVGYFVTPHHAPKITFGDLHTALLDAPVIMYAASDALVHAYVDFLFSWPARSSALVDISAERAVSFVSSALHAHARLSETLASLWLDRALIAEELAADRSAAFSRTAFLYSAFGDGFVDVTNRALLAYKDTVLPQPVVVLSHAARVAHDAAAGARGAVSVSVRGVVPQIEASLFRLPLSAASAVEEIRRTSLALVADAYNVLFGSGARTTLHPSGVTANIFDAVASTSASWARDFFGGVAKLFRPLAESPRVIAEPLEDLIKPVVKAPAQTGGGETVVQNYNDYVTLSGVSRADLVRELEILKNGLLSEIYKFTARAEIGIQGNTRAIQLTNVINQLANTAISNPSISGGSISGASSIGSGTGSFSGALSAGSLSVSGDISSGSFIVSGGKVGIGTSTPYAALSVEGASALGNSATAGFFTATSTTATSTFAGRLALLFAPTTPHTFSSWAPNVANTAGFDAPLIVNPATAIGDGNLITALVAGATKFIVDAEGDVFANSITASGGVTLSTTTASTFNVEGNTALGDSLTDTTTITGTLTVNASSTFSVIQGNVGIGTTSPWAKLSVAGSAGATQPLFTISTSTAFATSTALHLTSDGKFGIGTSSPSQQLSVAGNTLISGNLTLGSLSGFLKATAGVVSTALIDLANDVSGILGVVFGGTGWGNITANALLIGNGTNKLATTTAGTNGQTLALVSGVPSWVATTTFSSGLTYSGGNVTADLGTSIDLSDETNLATAWPITRANDTLGFNGLSTSTAAVAGNIPYFSGVNTFDNVATTSLAFSSAFSHSGAAGALLGGSSGTLSLAGNGVALSNLAQIAANSVLGNTTGASGNVAAIATSTLGIALSDTTGTLPETRGGTNQTSYATGDILYASSANTLSKLAAGTGGQVLAVVSGIPGWVATTTLSTISGLLNLATQVSGTIPIGNGGTATTTFYNGGVAFYNSTLGTLSQASAQSGLFYNNTTSRLGIGTAAPATTLDITGTARLSSTLTISNSPSCTGSNALQTDASGNVACGAISPVSGASSAGGWTTNSIGDITLSTTTDRVGVGATTTPYAKLSILSGATATTTLALVPVSAQTANILDIYNTSGVLSSVFTAGGRLGIGTSSPGTLLSLGNTGADTINISGTATSTFGNGISASRLNTSATSTFAGVQIGTGGLSVGSLSGFLKATAGVVSTALIDLANDVSGILGVVFGGTGWGAIQANTLLLGNGTSQLATTSAGTNGQTLALVNGVPSWVSTTTFSGGLTYSGGNVTADLGTSVDLAAEVTGTLPIANGGTATTTFYNGGVAFYNSSLGTLSQASAQTGLFYDNTTSRLGIGTTTPFSKLTVVGPDTLTSPTLSLRQSNDTSYGFDWDLESASVGRLDLYRVVANTRSQVLSILRGSGNLGVASTSPWGLLSVNPNGITGPSFVVGSSTATSFQVDNGGITHIGGTSAFPATRLNLIGGSGTVVSGNPDTNTLFRIENNGATNLSIVGASGSASTIYFGTTGASANTTGRIVYNNNSTLASGSMAFYTANSERLRIDGSGNVGIGTTTPLDLLSLGSNTLASDAFIRVASKNNVGLILEADTDNVTETHNPYVKFIQDGSATNGILGFTGGGGIDPEGTAVTGGTDNTLILSNRFSNVQFAAGGAVRQTILSSTGNVGIGTTTPGNLLTLSGSSPNIQVYSTGLNRYASFGISDGANTIIDNTGGGWTVLKAAGTAGLSTVSGGVSVGTYAGATAAPANGLIVSGNVGIGQVSPGSLLHVGGTTLSTRNLQIDSNGVITSRFDDNSLHNNLILQNRGITAVGNGVGINFVIDSGGGAGTQAASISAVSENTTFSGATADGNLVFAVTLNGASSEAARLTSTTLSIDEGAGKITVGTIDPVYTIGGTAYATYVAGMIGQKEEVTGTANIDTATTDAEGNTGYVHVIDFDEQETASDLWLFGQATQLNKNIDKLVALLTPEGNAKVWYQIDKAENRITLLSNVPTKISYRFTAPRFDFETWTNFNHDGVTGFEPPATGEQFFSDSAPAFSFGTAEFGFDVSALFDSLKEYIIAWLADNMNNIGEVFARVVNARERICVDGECLTADDVRVLKALALTASAATGGRPTSASSPESESVTSDVAQDTEAPTITIFGNNPAEIAIGDTYADLGASVSDDTDQNLGIHTFVDDVEVSSVSLDTSTSTTYTITYRATDQAGNVGSATRTVIVGNGATSDVAQAEEPAQEETLATEKPVAEESVADETPAAEEEPAPSPEPEPTPQEETGIQAI